MRRRTVLAGLGALGAVVAAGLYRFTDLITPHYPKTPYDDVLAQLGDRESARILGKAALQGRLDFDAAWAAARLRQMPRLKDAISADIAAGRMGEVAGWVLPESLVLAAALAANS
jgi:hypothetical protein